MTINFADQHLPSNIILEAICYYVSYKLSYHEIEDLLAETSINTDH
ncbi:Transposase [Candidatus Enterovibrio escicola]|uniref:Transposase n=1 Tax=Candidatus Enterovibrio escicola TaxID=1927127 RepID=A0A2A5T5W4_9GAMM|nr:Transposase [Candidatus Enterovibrio escacola]